MRRHLLPALAGPVVMLLSLDVGHVMLSIAGLGFLGLGIQPPNPEWGTMLVDARPFMQLAPHLVLPPGLAILTTVFGFNSFGEALDHWLNPKSRS
jgi:ABC-type dipeptide/oligopeptide/nickel transport system permease subunit